VKEDPPSGSASGLPVDREVFALVPGAEPVQIPSGWTVRGYTPANTIDDQWYGNPSFANNPYSISAARSRGNWLFPETGFYNDQNDNNGGEGPKRQTFMVRFEGGTGTVKGGDSTPVLVLAPSISTTFRTTSPWSLYPDPTTGQFPFRPDLEADPVRFVRRVAAAPATGQGSLTFAQRQALVGDLSSDIVLTRPVGQIAVCNEKRLAQSIGAQLDPVTSSLYKDPSANNWEPRFVDVRGTPWSDTNTVNVNAWIEGHLTLTSGQAVDSDCRIFAVQRYLGWLQEITGTSGGQGVGQ
jgi:hypothetical protein